MTQARSIVKAKEEEENTAILALEVRRTSLYTRRYLPDSSSADQFTISSRIVSWRCAREQEPLFIVDHEACIRSGTGTIFAKFQAQRARTVIPVLPVVGA